MTKTAERVNRHRAKMREAGMRLIQLWVPDTRRPDFADECRRQSLSLRNDPQEKEIVDWLEAVADRTGWE